MPKEIVRCSATVFDRDLDSNDFIGYIELELNEIMVKPGLWIN